MDPAKYEYQSELARSYFAKGSVEGEAHGRADVVLKLLALKFGPLSAALTARVQSATIAELDVWAERILSVKTLKCRDRLPDFFRAAGRMKG